MLAVLLVPATVTSRPETVHHILVVVIIIGLFGIIDDEVIDFLVNCDSLINCRLLIV